MNKIRHIFEGTVKCKINYLVAFQFALSRIFWGKKNKFNKNERLYSVIAD